MKYLHTNISPFLLVMNILLLSSCSKQPEKDITKGALKSFIFQNTSNTFPDYNFPEDAYNKGFRQSQLLPKINQTFRNVAQWESIGPDNIGGRTLCLAINPNDTNQIWAGSASGGLWKSNSGGLGKNAWQHIKTGFPVLAVSCIALHPKETNSMLIGTGEIYNYVGTDGGKKERTLRGSWGIGILKSVDGGNTWSHSLNWSSQENQGVWKIIFDPLNPNIIYAATTQGVYKSINDGSNWQLILDKKMCMDMMVDPQDPLIVYVGVGGFGCDDYGIYKSHDGGISWSKLILETSVNSYKGRIMLGMYKSNPKRVYALLSDAYDSHYFLRSRNNFDSLFINGIPSISSYQGWYAKGLYIKDTDSSQILAGGVDLFFDERGTGNNFNRMDMQKLDLHVDFHDIVSNPLDPNKIYLATDGGIYRSDHFSHSFYSCNGGYTSSQFYAGTFASQFKNIAIGGLQDNHSAIYTGSKEWRNTHFGDGVANAINHSDTNIMFCSAQNLFLSKSTDFGINWNTALDDRANGPFVIPLKMSATNENLIYTASTQIYKSVDNGNQWVRYLSNTNESQILTIEISPINDQHILLSTGPNNNEHVELLESFDGGKTLRNITSNLPNKYITDIAINPKDEQIIYTCLAGFGNDHVYKSINGGLNWEPLGNELPDVPFHSIFINPSNTNQIYVGCDLGLFVSFDEGAKWYSYNMHDYDAVQVYDLVYIAPEHRLGLFTHGHGAFKVDFINTPPTQTNTEIKENKILQMFLFECAYNKTFLKGNDYGRIFNLQGQVSMAYAKEVYDVLLNKPKGIYYFITTTHRYKIINI